jgi:hypothetical protein
MANGGSASSVYEHVKDISVLVGVRLGTQRLNGRARVFGEMAAA